MRTTKKVSTKKELIAELKQARNELNERLEYEDFRFLNQEKSYSAYISDLNEKLILAERDITFKELQLKAAVGRNIIIKEAYKEIFIALQEYKDKFNELINEVKR